MSKDAKKPNIGSARSTLSFKKLQQASILILLAVLCAFASFRSPTFFSWTNLVDNLLTNAAALGIIAIGMTFVMIAGGFDLSVASNTAVCSVVLVLTMDKLSPCGAIVAISAALLLTAIVGIGLGAINGVLIARVGVNPFVVTLSTMLVFRGIALILTHGGQAKQVAEIALAFNEVAPVCQCDQSVFNGCVSVRMELHAVADDVGDFDEFAVIIFVKRVQDAALHRFQAVFQCGDRAVADDICRILKKVIVHKPLERTVTGCAQPSGTA